MTIEFESKLLTKIDEKAKIDNQTQPWINRGRHGDHEVDNKKFKIWFFYFCLVGLRCKNMSCWS